MATLRMSRRAAKDARTARAWYAERNPLAAAGFDRELDDAARLIADFPLACPVVDAHGRRRAPFHSYPYALIYSVRGTSVTIVAVRHDRRAPER